jgi:hypothetical protein
MVLVQQKQPTPFATIARRNGLIGQVNLKA